MENKCEEISCGSRVYDPYTGDTYCQKVGALINPGKECQDKKSKKVVG